MTATTIVLLSRQNENKSSGPRCGKCSKSSEPDKKDWCEKCNKSYLDKEHKSWFTMM